MFVVLLGLFTTDAHAVDYTIDFCVQYATNYGDLGGDFWTSNVNRPARGVFLHVVRTTSIDLRPVVYTLGVAYRF